MSNIFKSNTRFSALMDTTPIPRKQTTTTTNINKKKEFSYDELFPEFIVTNKETSSSDNVSNYIDKITNVAVGDEDEKELLLKPGWVLLKRDRTTNKTTFDYHPLTKYSREPVKTENEIATTIMERLATAYEKRTEEYIANYGYDEWDTRFKFPDWRECEIYLEKMEELNDETDEKVETQDECDFDTDIDIYYDAD